jgi:N-acylneuraminate cytidylyltransferase
MIQGYKVLGVIPARGGSKGVPGKNIRDLCGKPMIAWTIEEAKKSAYMDRVIVSSDDESIIQVAKLYGADVPFTRPAELAQDDTPGIEPVLHALKELPGYDFVVLLQPTSPLRQVADIDGCIETCIRTGANACVSVVEPEHHPNWMFITDRDGYLHRLSHQEEMYGRRQELPSVYALNGAVYVAKVNWLCENRSFLGTGVQAYVMSRENSIDVDTELDLRMAAMLLASRESSGWSIPANRSTKLPYC